MVQRIVQLCIKRFFTENDLSNTSYTELHIRHTQKQRIAIAPSTIEHNVQLRNISETAGKSRTRLWPRPREKKKKKQKNKRMKRVVAKQMRCRQSVKNRWRLRIIEHRAFRRYSNMNRLHFNSPPRHDRSSLTDCVIPIDGIVKHCTRVKHATVWNRDYAAFAGSAYSRIA